MALLSERIYICIPLPHGEATDLPRRPHDNTAQEERDRGQMPP